MSFVGRGVAGRYDAILRAVARERKARVDLRRYSQEKGTCVRARSLCVDRLPHSGERPSARARFSLCNASDFELIDLLFIFCGRFY